MCSDVMYSHTIVSHATCTLLAKCPIVLRNRCCRSVEACIQLARSSADGCGLHNCLDRTTSLLATMPCHGMTDAQKQCCMQSVPQACTGTEITPVPAKISFYPIPSPLVQQQLREHGLAAVTKIYNNLGCTIT